MVDEKHNKGAIKYMVLIIFNPIVRYQATGEVDKLPNIVSVMGQRKRHHGNNVWSCKKNYFRLESFVYPHPLEIKHIRHYINKVGLCSDNATYIILCMYVYHSYVDHLTIDGSTSYFAKALTQGVNSQWTFNLYAAEFA